MNRRIRCAMRLLRRLVAIGCGFSLVLGALASCEPEQDQPAVDQRTDTRVADERVVRVPKAAQARIRTQAAEIRPLERLITAPGEVALDLDRVAKITTRIDGQVEQMFVRLGDRIHRGQALAAIGSLRLDELIERFLVTKAQAQVATHRYRRTRTLWNEKIAPDRRLIDDRGAYQEALARYQHAREKLLNLGLTNDELQQIVAGSHGKGHSYTLKTPIEGIVVHQDVVLGEGVTAGAELFKVVDTSTVWVFANLPIEEARHFTIGDRGAIVPRGGDPVEAPLSYTAPVADPKTRTVQVRFDVPNGDGYLKPREYVDVQLTIRTPPTLAVPGSAVTMVREERGVFRREADGFIFTPITVGQEGRAWIEVVEGIQPGNRVATDGVLDLKSALLQEVIQGEAGS